MLSRYRTLARDARASILPAYREYIASFSSDVMAVSLETATWLLVACRVIQPRRIADLGSGFSSFVLRHHARSSGAEVWSVDSDPAWLEVSRRFLAERSMPSDRLLVWEEFLVRRPTGGFDLILHDLGLTETMRGEVLPQVLDLSSPQGLVVLDDIHKQPYATRVEAELERRSCAHLSLRSYTRDRFGRFALLVMPGELAPAT
jgi:predicted O-methyltransferase YrrM